MPSLDTQLSYDAMLLELRALKSRGIKTGNKSTWTVTFNVRY